MKTPSNFLFYDATAEEWLEASIESLTMQNDTELYVIPVYEDDSRGEQITWGEWVSIQNKTHIEESERRKAEAEAKKQAEAERAKQEAAALMEAEREKERKRIEAENKKLQIITDFEEKNKAILASNLNAIRAEVELTGMLARKFFRLFMSIFWINMIIGGVLLGVMNVGRGNMYAGIVGGLLAGIFGSLIIIGITSAWEEEPEKKLKRDKLPPES